MQASKYEETNIINKSCEYLLHTYIYAIILWQLTTGSDAVKTIMAAGNTRIANLILDDMVALGLKCMFNYIVTLHLSIELYLY
jgi:hypothetical protein